MLSRWLVMIVRAGIRW